MVRSNANTPVRTHTCTHTHAHTHARTHAHMQTHAHTHTHTRTHAHKHKHTTLTHAHTSRRVLWNIEKARPDNSVYLEAVRIQWETHYRSVHATAERACLYLSRKTTTALNMSTAAITPSLIRKCLPHLPLFKWWCMRKSKLKEWRKKNIISERHAQK